ncbi:MAG TPA: glycerate kinase [Xanthobacteraceae bacterium]|nr:glycerate kinase [Xanthobacteraceae bacterium]
MHSLRTFLDELYRIAVAAAHPASCLVPRLPDPPAAGRLIILAAGKAAGSMTEIAERHYLDDLRLSSSRLVGAAVTRRGYGRPTRIVTVTEAGHPVPDDASLAAAERALSLAEGATADDLVLVLLSGGASANWIAPSVGLTLAEKQAVNRALLRSGATISEINAVRKHLSRIKGGRLGRLAYPARMVTLAVSDVSGDDPAVIGSGPSVPDPTTLADARAVMARFRLDISPAIGRALADPANETPKPQDPAFDRTAFRLIARPKEAFRAAEAAIRAHGYECKFLGDRIEGEARDVAVAQARLAKSMRARGQRGVIVSGGELTVTIRGKGRGGPNQEYALALAQALQGTPGIAAIAGDTDGTDGGAGSPNDPAGAFIDDTTLARAKKLGLDPAAFLAENDSTGFFERLGDLLQPGPTYTNVNDFRAIFVDPQ